ncbi:stalk domain-containing protein [Paenibacillus motobuensis]|uniref:Copper amine oxidase-like N-terminal domain-containing protein n=1 Tax=Paenibacillus motobuensis TaxID=295324 RepID=A0ABN0YLM8_9BACL
MKMSKVLGTILASALVTSSVVAATAAAAEAGPKPVAANSGASQLKVVSGNVTIDGDKISLKTMVVGKTMLYSLRDLAGGLGATIKQSGESLILTDSQGLHEMSLKAGSKSYSLDGATAQFTIAPQVVGGSLFVEPITLVHALGGEVLETGELRSVARLNGQFATPLFDASGNVIVSQEDVEALQLIKLGKSGQVETFSDNSNAIGAAVSPDGSLAAFTDEQGALFLMNTASGRIKPLGTDTSVKTDLVWSADGKKIYFIQGDKQEKIAYISLDTGKITQLLADKVENKSEVQVSADGKKLVYFVNVTGKAETDKEGTEESLTIDYSQAGSQVFSLELGNPEAKPVQLTQQLDNKIYLSLLSDGSVAYISADPEGKVENDTLKIIPADGSQIRNLVADVNVISSESLSGKLIVLAETADGTSKWFEVSASGAKTELFSTNESVSDWTIASNGTIAFIADGKVVLVQGGKVLELTK